MEQTRTWINIYGGFLKYPQIINKKFGFSLINHPAIGDPPWIGNLHMNPPAEMRQVLPPILKWTVWRSSLGELKAKRLRELASILLLIYTYIYMYIYIYIYIYVLYIYVYIRIYIYNILEHDMVLIMLADVWNIPKLTQWEIYMYRYSVHRNHAVWNKSGANPLWLEYSRCISAMVKTWEIEIICRGLSSVHHGRDQNIGTNGCSSPQNGSYGYLSIAI